MFAFLNLTFTAARFLKRQFALKWRVKARLFWSAVTTGEGRNMTARDVKREMDRQRKIPLELGTMHRSHRVKPKAPFAAVVTRRPVSFWSTETQNL